MPSVPLSTPLTYQPSFEQPEEGEQETIDAIIESMRKIAQTVADDSQHAERSVHAKSHGLLKGEMRVLENLPTTLAQGIFATPATYPVLIRFSTTPGDVLDDHISTPRGMAVKVIGVMGERVSGTDQTQDLVMVNGPAFNASTAKAFLKNIQLLAGTTDKANGAKRAASALFRGTEKVLEAFGAQSGTLKALGGHPITNILGETYYSQTPFLFGPYMAKMSIGPIAPSLVALKDEKVDLHDKPNGLRDAVVQYFAEHSAEWEVRVQLCVDLSTMPIEDASVPWPEDQSPYIAVARISVPAQSAWDAERQQAMDDGLSFTPWHCVAAHRPLGSINRVRRLVYEKSAAFRSTYNRKSITEPTAPPEARVVYDNLSA